MLFLLIIIVVEISGFLTKKFLEIFLRRETTTSWLTPRPSWSLSHHHFCGVFCFPWKSLSGNISEEGGNYVLANTSAYLLFLLIIIEMIFFYFLTKVFAAGWQKLCECTKGLRQKEWTLTKIFSPNIHYFVAILSFVANYALFDNLWTKEVLFLGQKQCWGRNYIVYYVRMILS